MEAAESEQLRHQMDQLREEFYQFTMRAVHDLRSAQRGVTTSAQLLEGMLGDSLTADARLVFERLIESSARANAILTAESRYAAASHVAGYSFRTVKLAGVIDAAVAQLEPEIRASGAAIHRGGLPEVWGDRDQLVELFRNLLDNALKYRGEAPPKVDIESQKVTGRQPDDLDFMISLRDYGMGIDRKYQRDLFQPFRRLHGPEIPGVGLGLLISRKIVEAHSGRLWIESEAGRGLTAFFTLPVPA